MKRKLLWSFLICLMMLVSGCVVIGAFVEQTTLQRTASAIGSEPRWPSIEDKLLCGILARGASIDDALVKIHQIYGDEGYGSYSITITFIDLLLANRFGEIRVKFDVDRKITKVELIKRIGSSAEEMEVKCE